MTAMALSVAATVPAVMTLQETYSADFAGYVDARNDRVFADHATLRRDSERVLVVDTRILDLDGDRAGHTWANLTVDHIVPVSKGGKSTFGNQVAACKSCNGFKADRTPREAGIALRHAPFVYDPWAQDQKEVWELFTLRPKTG